MDPEKHLQILVFPDALKFFSRCNLSELGHHKNHHQKIEIHGKKNNQKYLYRYKTILKSFTLITKFYALFLSSNYSLLKQLSHRKVLMKGLRNSGYVDRINVRTIFNKHLIILIFLLL